MRGSSRIRRGAAIVLALLGCASAPATVVPAHSAAISNVPALDSVMPAQIGRFALVERGNVQGTDGHRNYRYRDSSAARVSVYLYRASGDGTEAARDPRGRVAREGSIFLRDILPIQVRRGIYDSFEVLISREDSATVDGSVVRTFVTGARVHRRGETANEMQYVHLIGGDFVKVRATLPVAWPISVLQSFDSVLVQRLGRR